eukprot:2574347-Rhodomonas_salina.2
MDRRERTGMMMCRATHCTTWTGNSVCSASWFRLSAWYRHTPRQYRARRSACVGPYTYRAWTIYRSRTVGKGSTSQTSSTGTVPRMRAAGTWYCDSLPQYPASQSE